MYTYTVQKLVKVVDGDTIDVIIDLGFSLFKQERIRLAGIDTPESRTRNLAEKAMGLEAKAYLKMRLKACKKLVVRTEKEGKYGRMIGWLYEGNPEGSGYQTINEDMILLGYAWAYDGTKKVKDLNVLKEKRNGSPVI